MVSAALATLLAAVTGAAATPASVGFELSAGAAESIRATHARGGRVVAVGTTSVRSLETAAAGGALKPYRGDTRLFIRPGFRFRVVDALITLISDSFYKTYDYLMTNEQDELSILVMAGSWIEALYISTQISMFSADNSKIVEIINEQSTSLERHAHLPAQCAPLAGVQRCDILTEHA